MTTGETNYAEPENLPTDYLEQIDWGENYPEEQLFLTDKEKWVLGEYSHRGTLTPSDGKNWELYGVLHIARGKEELQRSRDVPVQDLGEEAKRVLLINHLFPRAGDKVRVNIGKLNCEDIMTRTAKLDKIVGESWRTHANFVCFKEQTIEDKVAKLDKTFGNAWKIDPTILGNSWKTIISSTRALGYLDITPQNTKASEFFKLLRCTLLYKRKSAVFIRRSILEHTQIRNTSQKRKKSTMAQRRRRQTAENRQTELEEIEEFKMFLRHVGVTRLVEPTQKIAAHAYEKGYLPPRSKSE